MATSKIMLPPKTTKARVAPKMHTASGVGGMGGKNGSMASGMGGVAGSMGGKTGGTGASDTGASKTGHTAVFWARLLFIASVLILLLFGLMMVYSASSIVALTETGNPAYYFLKQLQFVGIGIVLAVVIALFNYRIFSGALAWLFWGFVVALLIYTLVGGLDGGGSRRWIELGSFNFQPGELAKVALLFISTHLITKLHQSNPHQSGASTLLLVAAACGVFLPVLLILAQPDLGTAAIALVGVIVIMWLGDLPLRTILLVVGILAVLACFAVFIEGFRQNRIASFLNPWASPSDEGYQIINSFYAFGEGGLTGVGLGQSHQKFHYLPKVENDFIFAIIGEELGLIGAFGTALLFLLFIFSGLMVARSAPDVQGKMIAGTATVLIGFQAFLNMFCVLGWAPITGKPLPFISAGGTSMICSMALVGLVLSVAFHSDARTAFAKRRDSLLIMEGGAGFGMGRGLQRGSQRVALQRGSQLTGMQRMNTQGISMQRAGMQPTGMQRAKPIFAKPISANPTSATGFATGSAIGSATSRATSFTASSGRQRITSNTRPPSLSLASLSQNRTGLTSQMRLLESRPPDALPRNRLAAEQMDRPKKRYTS